MTNLRDWQKKARKEAEVAAYAELGRTTQAQVQGLVEKLVKDES